MVDRAEGHGSQKQRRKQLPAAAVMPAAAAGEHLLHPQPRRRRHEALADRLRRPTESGGKRPQDKRRRARLRPCRTAPAAPRASASARSFRRGATRVSRSPSRPAPRPRPRAVRPSRRSFPFARRLARRARWPPSGSPWCVRGSSRSTPARPAAGPPTAGGGLARARSRGPSAAGWRARGVCVVRLRAAPFAAPMPPGPPVRPRTRRGDARAAPSPPQAARLSCVETVKLGCHMRVSLAAR